MDVEADLERLYSLAIRDLPDIAYIYARLNREMAGTTNGDLDVFSGFSSGGPSAVGVDGISSVYGKWSALRDDLQNALGKSAKDVSDAADAVMSITKAYAYQDLDNARQILKHWSDYGVAEKYQISYDDYPMPAPDSVIMSKGE